MVTASLVVHELLSLYQRVDPHQVISGIFEPNLFLRIVRSAYSAWRRSDYRCSKMAASIVGADSAIMEFLQVFFRYEESGLFPDSEFELATRKLAMHFDYLESELP